MDNLVSIVIPTYNRGHILNRAIESILNQSYKSIEVIIVDDCSSDNTAQLMERYKDDVRVIYCKLKHNSGACYARNKGVDLSSGDYIGFLDSDDWFFPNKIEVQMKMMNRTKCDLCISNYLRVDEYGKKTEKKIIPSKGNEIIWHLLYCNFITTGTLIGKKECFQNIKFDENMPRYQDWDLAIRMAKKYTFCFVQYPLLEQEHQSQSITASTSAEKTIFSLKRILEKNIDLYRCDMKSLSQIKWLIGMNSLATDRIDYSSLWYGALKSERKLKRLIIVLLVKCGFRKEIYSKFENFSVNNGNHHKILKT